MSEAADLEAWLHAFYRDPAFLERYPYYAAILAKLQPVSDPSVQRMAVSYFEGRFFLHVNVESFMLEPQYLRGVLLHEVHHVALGHLGHPKFTGADEPDLMDLALEMSANEYIEEPLPNPIVYKAYAQIGIRAGQSTLERYDKLVAASEPGRPRERPGSADREDRTRRIDDHRFMRRAERDPGAVEHTRQVLQGSIDEVLASDPENADEDPKRRLLAGKNPGRLVEELTGALGPALTYLDWKTAIQMFVARSRAPVHTWSRPSRRFPDRVGAIPGRTYSPRVLVRPSLLVAIDTSMSMTLPELEEIARQLAVLAEHARITVVECDVEVTRTYPFIGALGDVAGRGGTDLRPVFEEAFLGKTKPDGVIYFTDGDGPFPERAPRLPVLWVLTKPAVFTCPWGERATLSRKAPRPHIATSSLPSPRGARKKAPRTSPSNGVPSRPKRDS